MTFKSKNIVNTKNAYGNYGYVFLYTLCIFLCLKIFSSIRFLNSFTLKYYNTSTVYLFKKGFEKIENEPTKVIARLLRVPCIRRFSMTCWLYGFCTRLTTAFIQVSSNIYNTQLGYKIQKQCYQYNTDKIHENLSVPTRHLNRYVYT